MHPSLEGDLSTTKCAPLLRCVIKDCSCQFPVKFQEKRVQITTTHGAQIATALCYLKQDQTETIDRVSNGRDSLEEKQIKAHSRGKTRAGGEILLSSGSSILAPLKYGIINHT